MNSLLLLFVVSLSGSLALTPLVSRTCLRFRWLDEPRDARRLHRTAIPRLGGVAIFAAMLIGLTALLFTNDLLTQTFKSDSSKLLGIVAPASLIFILGLYDDLRGTNAPIKFVVQVTAGLLFCLLGGRIEALSVPLAGSVVLHPIVGYALTLLWIVGITNAFNLIDGLDGLATGASLFAALVILAVSLLLGHPLIAIVAVVLCGSLVGFLPYNFNPASIFLGDSGSLFIGFMLAALSVLGAQKASTALAIAIPLIAFGVPVFDTSLSIARRIIGGRPIFQGDREHIHHMLMARGWSQRRVALVLYGVCALLSLCSLLFVNDAGVRTMGLAFSAVGAPMLLAIGRLRYPEIEEVKASLRRRFAERRQRIANNIRVRRISRAMSQATTLNEILNVIEELLELGEFVYAAMQIGHQGESQYAVAREQLLLLRRGAKISDGSIHWTWKRGNPVSDQGSGSARCWTLRLPLSTQNAQWGYLNLYREFGRQDLLVDINYLCSLFQHETAQAVARVMGGAELNARTPRLSVTLPADAQRTESVWIPAAAERNGSGAFLRIAV
jgi:UDP-GlcNAc:undecaprenyl-phosphate/decaprenyl-phosphate GlcNAc-1-phosphate transferase